MSAFIFPADPAEGDEFTPENGPTYIFNGYAWDVKSPAKSAPSTIVPPGVVVMWAGTLDRIPKGWALCDGTNNTPNLSGKFIMGPDSVHSMHTFGGSADATLVAHTHGMGNHTHPVNDPGHIHGTTAYPGNGALTGWSTPGGAAQPTFNPNAQTTSAGTGITIGPASGETSSAGVSPTGTNLPPYYVLAYIIKL
jgi:microcystin-dependent protein